MKKATLLLETILSLIIASSIFILSSQLYTTILKSSNEEFKTALITNELLSTKIFLSKKLEKNSIKNISSNTIEFYKFDKNGYLQGFYSGIIDLDKSSKEFLYTPKSNTTKLNSTKLMFPNKVVYDLRKSTKNNYLYLKNSLPKTIYEEYKIIENISTISYKNNTLYFNSNILQNRVTKFDTNMKGNLLFIDICIESSCQEWIF